MPRVATRLAAVFVCVVLAMTCMAQDAKTVQPSEQSNLSATLGFEQTASGVMPGGWSGWPSGTLSVDNKIVHSGRASARIERGAEPNGFSTVTKFIPVNFAGTGIELRGFLRTEDVSDFAGLWMREDGEAGSVAFDNMQSRQLKGTTEWTEYSIKLPIRTEARQLYFGFLLAGTGKTWADDLQLLVDGKPVWEVPKIERPKTALELDHEFDAGSGIVLNDLSAVQIQNLATLGKVWGFLKYHHPQVTSGQRHWDYELFRVLPSVLAANDRQAANAALLRWIKGLGTVEPCKSCARLDEGDLHFRPNLD